MRTARAVAAIVGTVIIGVLAWAAPAEATGTHKIVTSITDVKCGTATVNIVLAEGVAGVYNARYYLAGDEIGRVASTGTTKASKTVTLPEDSHGGMAELWVSVVDGPEADYRPKTISAKVPTNCQPPVGPVVTSTGPTCTNKTMTVKVTNPNTLPQDKIQVRIGFTASRWIDAGKAVEATVTHGPVRVWAGNPLEPLTTVRYVPPIGCPTAAPSASATAKPTATTVPTGNPTVGPTSAPTIRPSLTAAPVSQRPTMPPPAGGTDTNGSGGSQGGGLPVTGTAVAGLAGGALLLLTAGGVAAVAARRRRTRFTA